MNLESWDEISVNHVDNLVKKTAYVLKCCGITSVNMIDVGSNVGKFPERLVHYGINVSGAILCDIVPELVAYTANKFPNYLSLNVAVSDQDGADLECYNVLGVSDNYGLSRIVSGVYGSERDNVVHLKSTTLTSIIHLHDFLADFIKIDAEGYDIPAVYGLIPALAENQHFRPIILFECAAGVSAAELVGELNKLGYVTATSTPETHSRDIFVIHESLLTPDVADAISDMPYRT